MQKKSKVISVQSNGTWEGSYGTMYKFEVSFENGDTGEYSSKSKDQNKFVIGHETEYEFTDGKYPKVKPVYNPASGGSYNKFNNDANRQKMIVKQSSLKCAVDLCIADNKTDLHSVFKVANNIVRWVMEEETSLHGIKEYDAGVKDGIKKSTSIGSFVQHEESTIDKYHKSEDLPF